MADEAPEPPWLPLTEAATRLGWPRERLRARVRRGLIAYRKANDGGLLVQLPADLAEVSEAQDQATELVELREALARAEARLEAAEAVAQAKVEAAQQVAEAQVAAARAEADAVRQLADRLTVELVQLRQPWWRRWLQ